MIRRSKKGVCHHFSRWLVLCLAGAAVCLGQTLLTGRVVDENGAPVGRARVAVRSADPAVPGTWEVVSDPTGLFSLPLPAPGEYLFSVRREGYFELRDRRVQVEANHAVDLILNPAREVFQSVNVSDTPSPVDLGQTSLKQPLSGTEINDIPYSASHSLRNAMKLIPGVVQDPMGALHFQGAAEGQVLYTLNGFNIGDPITGRFNTRLGIEGVRSLDLSMGRFPAEFGKGSAGVMAIGTDTGTDQFHFTATNFVPGVDAKQGLHLGNWTPRFGVSGPIRRGRAWFADNFEGQYHEAVISGLPSGQDRQSGWSGANLVHTQTNLTPGNILFTDFLVNLDNQSNVGLGVLDPIETTTTVRSREYFFSLKDQMYFGHGVLFELGYARNYFSDRQVPRGQNLYVLSPNGRSGNYFVDSNQRTSRDQMLANLFLPAFRLFGVHQLKAGLDLDRLHYTADFRRTGYEIFGLAGHLLSKTTFQGSGSFRRSNSEVSSYLLDDWRVRKKLQLELGLRQDWDQLVRQVAVSPRIALSYSPFASGTTKFSAGYAVTRDATNLALFSRPLDQRASTTYYNPDGSVAKGPLLTVFNINNAHLRLPRSQNWTAGVDREFPHRIYASLNYLRRRGRDGFTYLSASGMQPTSPSLNLGSGPAGVFNLTNLRRDSYDGVTIQVRQTLAEQYEWMASYTRSRATSNAVLDVSVDQPLQVMNNLGPLPWDTPNRFLGWAYLPLFWKDWAVAVLADARSGFPFSITNEQGQILGAVNSRRFPSNFDLNVHLERRFTFHGYRFAIRAGINNITGHRNPTAVNNVSGSPQFLQFYGDEGRHAVLRLRLFGRSRSK